MQRVVSCALVLLIALLGPLALVQHSATALQEGEPKILRIW